MWKNLSIYGVPVALSLAFLNVYLNAKEHERPEFIPYDHLRIMTKVKIFLFLICHLNFF